MIWLKVVVEIIVMNVTVNRGVKNRFIHAMYTSSVDSISNSILPSLGGEDETNSMGRNGLFFGAVPNSD